MIDLFHIGQKVVCIEEWYPNPQGNTVPVKGEVYTIRGFCFDADNFPGVYSEAEKGIGLWLEEIVNREMPCHPDGHLGEISFNAKYFRPVNEQETWTTVCIKEPA